MKQYTGKNKQNIDVSIIIPAKNEEENIGKCLDAVFNQETAFHGEVIVIDSGSSDKTIDTVKKYPAVKLKEIPPEAFGHGKTRNLGAEISKGDYIVFLNADAIPANNHWLNSLLQPFGREKKLAGVYSRHIPKKGCHLYMARDILNSMPEKSILRHQTKALDFMIFSTVSCAIPRAVWEKYPFDNEIIIAEDQQWARHVLDQGFNIMYEPMSRVYHSHNYSPRQLYEVKLKVGCAEKKFKNKFSAVVLGFILMVGGIITKIIADTGFILFKAKTGEKMSFSQKLKEIKISCKARTASFTGRYKGWYQR